MNLLVRLINDLVVAFHLLLFLSTIYPLFLVLQHPPFILFLSHVALHAEHQQYLLPELIVQIHILLTCCYLVRNIHALQHLSQPLIHFPR